MAATGRSGVRSLTGVYGGLTLGVPEGGRRPGPLPKGMLDLAACRTVSVILRQAALREIGWSLHSAISWSHLDLKLVQSALR